MGLVKGYGMTTPDRFSLATWQASRGDGAGIVETAWDYTVDPGADLGDSTVASWWGPYSLQPGEERSVQTAYGLASAGGGQAWFDAPAGVSCEDSQFTATLWVSNASPDVLSGISATLSLPEGLTLVEGQSATQTIADLSPQQASSVSWVIVAQTAALARSFSYSAAVTFQSGAESVSAQATISVPGCAAAATATPTVPFTGPTDTPVVSVPTPTVSPTPAPEVPEPGSLALTGQWPRRPGRLHGVASPASELAHASTAGWAGAGRTGLCGGAGRRACQRDVGVLTSFWNRDR